MAGRPAGISAGESDGDDFEDYEAPASLPAKLRARPQQFNGGAQSKVQ